MTTLGLNLRFASEIQYHISSGKSQTKEGTNKFWKILKILKTFSADIVMINTNAFDVKIC